MLTALPFARISRATGAALVATAAHAQHLRQSVADKLTAKREERRLRKEFWNDPHTFDELFYGLDYEMDDMGWYGDECGCQSGQSER